MQGYADKKSEAKRPVASWPRARIEEGLKRAFKSILVIGEDDDHTVYDVADRAFRFVVALVHVGGPKAGVTEVGFLARFVGFRPTDRVLRKLNGELHLADAFIEEGDLYVLAKIAVRKKFSDNKFALILGAWKRDMSFALQALNQASAAPADYAADMLGFEPAAIAGRTGAFCKAYFWRNEPQILCPGCEGRGRRGFLARACDDCEGRGFIDPTR
ncbi:MAG: hypothetical protein HXY23_13085 [Parvularculaceae bacterium]|nr:hypothetical protein [Parvularculaceae bacterium]